MKEFVIDLFCGAGGTSEGIHLAKCDSQVIACVNHDETAIESHKLNHPKAKHFIEDIRSPEVIFFLKLRVEALRKLYPDCIITIWASLECTNFSKAKGGLPRDADSRTLANYMPMYLEALQPDFFMIENVVEFKAWGPLDENGKPLSMKKGIDFINWVERIKSYGYKYSERELNSADYGAYTSRNRYFAQFSLEHLPIEWPQPTHAKFPEKSPNLFAKPLKKWKAVKDVLELEKDGNSIFTRKKPLVENTLKRIYAGLVKFVANGDDSFIKKYYSGRPFGKVISINGPAGTVKTIDGQAYVKCDFILKYNSTNKNGKHIPPSINEPCPTVAVQNRLGKVSANFLQSYYGNGGAHDENAPCPTITTVDRFAKVNYLVMNYGNGNTRSIEVPGATILNNDKHSLVSAQQYLLNPQFKNSGNSIENPCPTIIARQDKKPLGLISCELGEGFIIPVYEEDCETMVKIKIFMATFGITDIKMRMLFVEELKQIQGFPKDYQLSGTQTEQKKFIGNSVEVTTAKKIFEAHHKALVDYFKYLKAA